MTQVSLHTAETLRRKGHIANINAHITTANLTKSARGFIRRGIQHGIYPGAYSPSCHIYTILMDWIGAPMMYVRKGQKGSSWRSWWSVTHARIPQTVLAALRDYYEADRVAAQLENPERFKAYAGYHWMEWQDNSFALMHMADIKMLREYTAAYASTPEYRALVAPALEIVESGVPFPITIS
jgi:hypothetical protein